MKVSDMKIDDEYVIVDVGESIQSITKKLLTGMYETALVMENMVIVGAINLNMILTRIVIEGRNPTETSGKDVMDKNILKVTLGTRLLDVDSEIRRKAPAAVVVVDDNEAILGYVSPSDMMEALQKISGDSTVKEVAPEETRDQLLQEIAQSFPDNAEKISSGNCSCSDFLYWSKVAEDDQSKESYLLSHRILLCLTNGPMTALQLAWVLFNEDESLTKQFLDVSIRPLNILDFDPKRNLYVLNETELSKTDKWLETLEEKSQIVAKVSELVKLASHF